MLGVEIRVLKMPDKIAYGGGVAAAAAGATPSYIYGEFLTKHGLYYLSYAEWIQVLGSCYVFCLLLNLFGILPFLTSGIKRGLNALCHLIKKKV